VNLINYFKKRTLLITVGVLLISCVSLQGCRIISPAKETKVPELDWGSAGKQPEIIWQTHDWVLMKKSFYDEIRTR